MDGTIVCYPSPGKGHLAPMVELSKFMLKHHPTFSVAIVLLPLPPPESDFISSYAAAVSASHPSISFHQLPSPSLHADHYSSSPSDFVSSTFEFVRLCNQSLQQILLSLSRSCKIKAFVIDLFCTAACRVSYSLNIPTYYFFTSGASGVAALLHIPTLHEKYDKSFKDIDELLEIPGFPPIMSKDMPQALMNRNLKTYANFLETSHQMIKSTGIIINTFDCSEISALAAIRNGLSVPNGVTPPTYCVGPLIATPEGSSESEERHECLQWLDSQPSQSVLFLSFGSMGVFSSKQLKEMALGLERSGVRFLWVVRAPPADDEAWAALADREPKIEYFLPDGFVERNREKGIIVEAWAPQVAVLSHKSVGGFVTHCGWNSLLEAISRGVPMLAWPLYAEQKLNRIYMVEKMKVALPAVESEDGLVHAADLEERVFELMMSEKGEVVRERVREMRDAALAALSDGGSSVLALAELLECIKQGSGEVEESDSVDVAGGIGNVEPVTIST